MIKAILTDLDGVIRLWDSDDELTAKESELGLPKGTVFKTCFAKELLQPTITGQITDIEWRNRVTKQLAVVHGHTIAKAAVQAWTDVPFDIDEELLPLYAQYHPKAKLIMVTNATSRLNHDLAQTNITDQFHTIINSSEVGIAKPEEGIFQAALAAAGVESAEAIFVDDSKANVDAAIALGLHAHHYTDKDALAAFLNETH